jgi:uncharacterized protein DUF4126
LLTAILSSAGLAGATGHRAFIPAFLLGLFHHVAPLIGSSFSLAGGKFVWLADPVVMSALGALMILEYVAEANPDLPEITEWALKAPKLIAGFVVVAAMVGTMDASMTTMVASGVLGAGTALTVDGLRAKVKHALNDSVGDATDGGSTKAMALAETGWSMGLTAIAVVVPILVAVAAVVSFGIYKGKGALTGNKFVPCPTCDQPRHPEATACPYCKESIPAASASESLPTPVV